MSYQYCTGCRGLLLAEDRSCRLCNQPVDRAEVAAAAPPAVGVAPSTPTVWPTVSPATWPTQPVPSPPVPTPPVHHGGHGARRHARDFRPAREITPSVDTSSRDAVSTDRQVIDLRSPVPTAAPAGMPSSLVPRPAATPRSARAQGARAAISVRSLGKVYGEGDLAVSAVKDVSFEVHDGEVVLIMGPSGSGKTTLLLMLGAMLRPSSGTVVIGGSDVSATPERRLPKLRASHLGFVFQDFNLLSALDAMENVELACNLAGVTGRQAEGRARLLLERVGLGHRLHHRPNQLSGGEKQRVAIARALANDPPLLLADEPTANLDSDHGREIADLLRRLADEDGRTALIVTHDDRLTTIADRVLWLEDGVISTKGGHR